MARMSLSGALFVGAVTLAGTAVGCGTDSNVTARTDSPTTSTPVKLDLPIANVAMFHGGADTAAHMQVAVGDADHAMLLTYGVRSRGWNQSGDAARDEVEATVVSPSGE